MREYCACFDSVSLCFSKGLGAPIGSVIIGSQDFIDAARHKRKSIGGGLRQAALITAPARVAVEQTFLGGKLRASHDRAREVANMWVSRGGKLERETETNMVWLDLEDVGLGEGDDGRGETGKGRRSKGFVEMGVERGVRLLGGRLVVHYRMYRISVTRWFKAVAYTARPVPLCLQSTLASCWSKCRMNAHLTSHIAEISTEAISRLTLLFDDIFAHNHRPSTPASKGVKEEAEKITAPEVE